MPHAIVLQPNGKYAIWSSIVDNFLYLDMTKDEAIKTWIDEAFLSGVDKKEAESAIKTQFDNIEAAGTAWDWSRDWNGCIGWLRSHDADTIKDIIELGIPLEIERNKHTELEQEHHWHMYWRNKCLRLESELIALKRNPD